MVRKSRLFAKSSRILLIATISPSSRRATYTTAMPPSAILARTWYLPSLSRGAALSLGLVTGAERTKGRGCLNRRTMQTSMRKLAWVWSSAVIVTTACKDQGKESAARASANVTDLAALVDKDFGEIERGMPAGAKQLAPLVAGGADPRQDTAGVRRAMQRARRDVPDLAIAKSTFFALADPGGVAIRNDLEEDVMAGQNLFTVFPALAKAKTDYTTTTGVFPNASAKNGPDRDWIAGVPVKRESGETARSSSRAGLTATSRGTSRRRSRTG